MTTKKTSKKAAKKPASRARTVEQLLHHRDGTLWARGRSLDGQATGYWEWYRKDGVRMRSGHFERGEPVGEWTTYDQEGKVHKVTHRKAKGG